MKNIKDNLCRKLFGPLNAINTSTIDVSVDGFVYSKVWGSMYRIMNVNVKEQLIKNLYGDL